MVWLHEWWTTLGPAKRRTEINGPCLGDAISNEHNPWVRGQQTCNNWRSESVCLLIMLSLLLSSYIAGRKCLIKSTPSQRSRKGSAKLWANLALNCCPSILLWFESANISASIDEELNNVNFEKTKKKRLPFLILSLPEQTTEKWFS